MADANGEPRRSWCPPEQLEVSTHPVAAQGIGVPCEIKFCKRHAQTNGAVEELKAVLREPQLSVRH
jgi:hypothetical protein